MKKAISVILVAALVFSLAAVGAAGNGADRLCFAVASDLHYAAAREALEKVQEDEVYFYANRRASMDDESGYIIDSFLAQCAADESIEYVLISGDLCDSGRKNPEDHRAVAEKLKAFEEQSGKSVFVIDGNHDLGSDSETDTALFKEIYADFGYDRALETRESDCSYTADLGDSYRLIALDSCNPDVSTADGMNADKLSWVSKQCELAKADGRRPILMMHHNLLDHLPAQRLLSRNFIVKFHYSTAELFADKGIQLVLTGHEHCSDATSYTSALGNTITDFATTALTMYPLQYRVFDIDGDQVNYTAKTVNSINTAALAAKTTGYTPQMLALMNSDLNAYAKGFMKKGVEYRLLLSLSMEKIGISQGEPFYNLVNTAVGELTSLLKMPLYGDNSVSALAAEYGIVLPETNYLNGWDLATELAAAHYEGSESYGAESTEVQLLLKIVNLVLRHSLPAVNDKVFLSALNELYGGGITADFSKLCTRTFGSVSAGERFVVALISPLLDALSLDDDGVDDNCGVITLQPEQASVLAAPINLLRWLLTIILKAVTFLK